jgi:hypothetical protein
MEKELTSLPVKKSTRKRLGGYVKKSETWDEAINRILDEKDLKDASLE